MGEPAIYTPVCVRWADSHSGSPGWKTEEEAMRSASDGIVVESIGLYCGILGEGEQTGLVLIQSRVILGCKDVDSALVIPVCAVKAFYTLRKT